MPEFPIVDTHVHFWDRAAVPMSWTRPHPTLDRPFLPNDLESDHGTIDVAALVVVEADVDAGHHRAEVDWIQRLADVEPRIDAIVAHVPLEQGRQAHADLEVLRTRPIVRGVRRLIQGQNADALCASPTFRDGVRLLPQFGLHFELCLRHDQLGAVLRLVEACPDVTFVLDHIAKPAIAAGLRQPWWDGIARLAAHPSVVCKISGVVTEADHTAWRVSDLQPYLAHTLDLFGPERVIFGSDWPVMRLATTYARWVEIVDAAVADWSEVDRRRLFVDNARRIYRL